MSARETSANRDRMATPWRWETAKRAVGTTRRRRRRTRRPQETCRRLPLLRWLHWGIATCPPSGRARRAHPREACRRVPGTCRLEGRARRAHPQSAPPTPWGAPTTTEDGRSAATLSPPPTATVWRVRASRLAELSSISRAAGSGPRFWPPALPRPATATTRRPGGGRHRNLAPGWITLPMVSMRIGVAWVRYGAPLIQTVRVSKEQEGGAERVAEVSLARA